METGGLSQIDIAAGNIGNRTAGARKAVPRRRTRRWAKRLFPIFCILFLFTIYKYVVRGG